MVIESYAGYYARGTILTEDDCMAIETARIKAIRNSRHAPAHPRLQVYTKTNEGGMGSNHTYTIAMAAWITETSNALSAPNGNPAGLMARRLLALTADRLGCEGISPLEWMP